MNVREFLKDVTGDVTFIKARARKDDHTPFYHAEYQTTPIRNVRDWTGDILDYIVLNDAQPPIDWLSGAPWQNAFNRGHLTSVLVIHPEDLELLYPTKDQRDHMIKFIGDKIVERKEMRANTSALRYYRSTKNLTQSELAKRAGVNLRTLQDYEQGHKDINKAEALTVSKLAQALECKVEDLLNL